jgi:hypothetical protein
MCLVCAPPHRNDVALCDRGVVGDRQTGGRHPSWFLTSAASLRCRISLTLTGPVGLGALGRRTMCYSGGVRLRPLDRRHPSIRW